MTTDASKRVEIPRTLTVRELSDLLRDTPVQIIKALMVNGVMADVSKTIDFDTAAVIAVDLGFEPVAGGDVVEDPKAVTVDLFPQAAEEAPASLQPRPPVVALLGHVDHGKTSLLDAIRQTKVQAGEAAGITQHIGAYQTTVNGRPITFIDTPGHEAFTQMRARGAEATDIAILVVAGNDGVMPQTREAISHIRAANVPIVVALNKIDTANVDAERVKGQLAEAEVVVEGYGGDVPLVPVSAVTKDGLDELLETVLLVADVHALRANPEQRASGVVLEAALDRRQGARTTLLVKSGTLHLGDALLVGGTWGKVKAMFDDKGERVDAASPSMPVSILGVQGLARAGDPFRVLASDKEARRLYAAAKRELEAVEARLQHAASLDALMGEVSSAAVKELNLILKTDVDGSVEPLRQSLEHLSNEEVHVKVIHAAPGAVSDTDVTLTLAAQGTLLTFNIRAEPSAQKLAETEGIEIRRYADIHTMISEIEAAVVGMLEPVDVEVIDAHAEVLQVFPIRRIGNVAGCRCDDGTVRVNQTVRVRRADTAVASGSIASLRRFQGDVQEVQAGQEFGVAIGGFQDFQPGDQLDFFHVERQSRVVSGEAGRPGGGRPA